MKTNYDILIIGSGLGGLVSALILAKEGLKVCVLEKNQQFGGNLQTFSRNKVLFDTGVHYLGGLAEGQNLNRYFKFLGIMNDLKLKKMDEAFDKITFDNDPNEYPQSQGTDNFVKNLTAFFPEEEDNLKLYCEEIYNVCKKFPRYFLVNEGTYDEQTLYRNTKDFINFVTDNKKLRAILAGNSFLYAGDERTPLYVHALTVNSYIQSAYKCESGGSQITKLLVRELRKYNVDLYKRTEVIAFRKDENHRLISVKTKNGKEFFAESFISNMELATTVELTGDAFKKVFVSRIKNLNPVISSFSVYIVLKPKMFRNFNYNYYHNRDMDFLHRQEDYDEKSWPVFYMLSSSEDKKNEGFAESLTILTSMRFDEVEKWKDTFNTVANPDERNSDYENFKNEKAKILINEIEKKFPDIRECIQDIYTSSPLSYRDYIGTKNGSMYGYVKDSSNPYKTMFSPKTKIDNLYLTGQTVNMHGILGVTIGAFATCAEILGADLMNQRLKGY